MVSSHELLVEYGAAVVSRNAGLFVGAGLSRPAYPTWQQLLQGPMMETDLPDDMHDLPLAAEYYVQSYPDGRERLERTLLEQLMSIDPVPHAGHASLARLPITEFWTTNYDPLLETAMPDALVVHTDDELLARRRASQRRIVKLHGSFAVDPPEWQQGPVITRTDYERYADHNPRKWASLTADFLTRPLLFLGFGFTDPNVELLLRLARCLETATPHYTVMRRPTEDDRVQDRLLFDHQVRDLEESRVGVVAINEYDEINPLLATLVRRTRDPQLFVAGSFDNDDEPAGTLAEKLGTRCTELDGPDVELRIASLAGPAGRRVSYAFGAQLRASSRYDPKRIQFHFRWKDQAPDGLEERTGSALHSDLAQDPLRRKVIDESRAMVVIGGGQTTRDEVAIADSLAVPVVPVACSGGTAAQVWEEKIGAIETAEMGGRPVDPDLYHALRSDNPDTAAAAAVRLLRQAMYLDEAPA